MEPVVADGKDTGFKIKEVSYEPKAGGSIKK